jgi:hypothetical protein
MEKMMKRHQGLKPAGQKGTPNKATTERHKAMQAALDRALQPLSLQVMRDEKLERHERIDAACR